MTNLTPDSPVEALWPDGEGGLNGRRALARLKAAGKTTVREVLPMRDADILAIPRAKDAVLKEVRRALNAAGLHLAGERAPSLKTILAAREAGQAQRETGRRHPGKTGEKLPVTPETFAVLVAALKAELALAKAADPAGYRKLTAIPRKATPEAFAGRLWPWKTVTQRGVAELTGYSPVTIRRYVAQARAARAAGAETVRTMPPPTPAGRWVIGDLAMWMATVNQAQATAHRLPIDDEEAQAIITAVREGREASGTGVLPKGRRKAIAAQFGVSPALVTKIAGGEVPVEGRRGTLASRQLRAEPTRAEEARREHRPTGLDRAHGESVHPAGLLTPAEVAADWGISTQTVYDAIRECRIIARREGVRLLIDPKRLRARTDWRRTPVDVSHPMARPEPGDEGYEEKQ